MKPYLSQRVISSGSRWVAGRNNIDVYSSQMFDNFPSQECFMPKDAIGIIRWLNKDSVFIYFPIENFSAMFSIDKDLFGYWFEPVPINYNQYWAKLNE